MTKITINKPDIAAVYLDGKLINFKKVNECYTAESDVAGDFNLRIVRIPETLFKNWFLRALVFWIISVAGIFTPWYDGKGAVLNYEMFGSAGENCEINLNLLKVKSKVAFKQAVYVDAKDINVYSESGAAYQKDKTAVRRKRLYTAFSWLMRIVLSVLVIVFAVI